MSAYLILFVTAFGAATILPFYSEVMLVSQLKFGYSPAWLWVAATSGNTLGAVVNWYIGLKLLHFSNKKWFIISERNLQRSQIWFQKYGKWSLLMAWMPVGGDALTFVGGMMRVRLLLFVLLVGLGKGLRYLVVIVMFQAI